MGQGTKVGALLELDLLEGDEEGCLERLGDPDGEFEGPADGWDEGPEEAALLEIGSLEGDGQGCVERLLGDPKKQTPRIWLRSKATQRTGPRDQATQTAMSKT